MSTGGIQYTDSNGRDPVYRLYAVWIHNVKI